MEVKGNGFRIGASAIGLAGLAVIYLFQYTDFLFLITGRTFSEEYHFIFNRTIRILVNDSCMLLLIYAIFSDQKALKLAFYVQLIDLFVLFPIYLVLKLSTEGASELSSPFLSQFHRLIVNPTLMILLVPAIFYQRIASKMVS
jgi:exosortase F-associated protein